MTNPNTTPAPNNNPSKEILSKNGFFLNKESVAQNSTPNIPTQLTQTQTHESNTTLPPALAILGPSGAYSNLGQAILSGAIPEFLSSAKWSDNAQGFPQQTFLGASIRSFSMNGGFGDNSSTLTVDLVVDEWNKSDNTLEGVGDDVYHSGGSVHSVNGLSKTVGDRFVPPIPGSPVYFKFGPNFATVEEAYRKTFDDLYGYNTIDNTQDGAGGGGGNTLENIIDRGSISFTPPTGPYVDLHLDDVVDGGPTNATYKYARPSISYNSRIGPSRGKNHIVFGGILQSYTQNRTPNGNPLYTVTVVDPREILSNVTLILNNYAGSTYGQQNILNIYGFLEYNLSADGLAQVKAIARQENPLKKIVNTNNGTFTLQGDDKYWKSIPPEQLITSQKQQIKDKDIAIENLRIEMAKDRREGKFGNIASKITQINNLKLQRSQLESLLLTTINNSKPSFPMTGTGFSRRGTQGIPYYRVEAAVNAILEYEAPLPLEYKEQGFGTKINFRGFNYVIDFGSLPELPKTYFLDFDQINLLELALEICDITNRDLFVSLLPVINHPACSAIKQINDSAKNQDLIAGIIRLDAIDRSSQPQYGAIKDYIDNLAKNKIYVENQDLGYELSNIVTDKFIVGAQEVELYFFSANADRDNLAYRKTNSNNNFPGKPVGYQWTLQASLEQQILPYYGKLGNNAITIPKGFGAYQQILLDSSSLNAAGVGSYYVATEMELRCALISFDRWKEFLKLYNDVYLDSIEKDDGFDAAITGLTAQPQGGPNPPVSPISTSYAVSVPRSVFNTYAVKAYGDDGLPFSPCNPPYGYPLYYKRMTKIGIPEGGLTDLYSRWTTLQTNFAELRSTSRLSAQGVINSQYTRLRELSEQQPLSQFEQDYFNELEKLLKNPTPAAIQASIALLEKNSKNRNNVFAILPSVAKKNNQNAIKVYEFVKSVAEECLGKKFLVKIPKEVNLFYDPKIVCPNLQTGEYTAGPFGFRPRTTKTIISNQIIPGYQFSAAFKQEVRSSANPSPPSINMMQSFLSSGIAPNPTKFAGALSINFNPISEKYESNYKPLNIGGYFPFELYQNTLGVSQINEINKRGFQSLPSGVQQGLIPQDLTNFLDEDGRVHAYVRFDNSQFLTIDGLNSSDYSQQIIVANSFIPDLVDALDNTGNEFHSFPNTNAQQNNQTQPPPGQILFLKCSVDENLYMPPKTFTNRIAVHGTQVKDIGTKSMPRKIFIPCSGISGNGFVPGSGVYVDSMSFYKANFVPLPVPGPQQDVLDFVTYNFRFTYPGGALAANDSVYINTEISQLDTNHVYALITLPNRVLPNKDSRHRDGHFQTMSAERFKHLMTMDTVRGLPGFNQPTNPPIKPLAGPVRQIGQVIAAANNDAKVHAWLAMKKVHSAMSFGFPQALNVSMPSPVYPDLVALPLMSNDRCYGPWVSSHLDGQGYLLQNIGGRVEFIKDETLSPWNYGGYQLLNEAGRMQAEFANSLMLFSERGSFTIPSIPLGNSLGRALVEAGPLVTSINVDVSTGGARTTYQMDLYTASFGKLQKQKSDEISKISRERKKLTSERNALIRKGLGKNQSNRNFLQEYNMMMKGSVPSLNQLGLGLANAYTRLVASVSPSVNKLWSSSIGNNTLLQQTEYETYGSMQNTTTIGHTAQNFIDQFQLAENYQNSAASEITDIFTPASHGYHANMSYRPNSSIDATHSLYFIDDEDDSMNNGITKYGDRA